MMRKSECLKKHNILSHPRMSATGSESLRSSVSPYKLRVEHNVSESEMNVGNKKRKVSFAIPVEMETESPEALFEPVVMKMKRRTGNGHSYKAKFKGKCKDKIVPVEMALGQTEKLTNYQEKEQVHSHKNLKRKIVKDSAGSHIDCFQKDSFKEEHTENQILSQQRQAVKDKGAGSEANSFGKKSVKEEHYENQMLSEQKQAVKDKDAGSDLCHMLNKIKRNCHKRMVKLIQKQQEQTQKFHQIWEKKRTDERDNKSALSMIQSIHDEDATRTNNKPKLLNDIFAKKMKEHNLQKEAELKNLETEQLSAKDEERRKEDHWLALCCSGEPTAHHGLESLGLLSKEVERDVPFGNSSNSLSTDPQNELGVAFSQTSVLAGVEQLDQLKNIGLRQIICALPASRGSVPGRIRAVELNKDVPPEVPKTVPNEIGHYANPVELSKLASDNGIDKEDAIGLPDALVNLVDENDEAVAVPIVEQMLEPLEQTKASWTPHHCTLLLPQASEDPIPCSSIPDVVQDIGALVLEAQNASSFEVAISQSNIELQDQEMPATESQITSEIATTGITDTVTREESIVKAPVLEDQYTWQIENTDSELIGTENPVQDLSAPVVEKQRASPFEVATSVHVDIVTVAPPNIELQDQDARGEVANLDAIGIASEELSGNFQDQDASVLEEQATSQVDVANLEPVNTVNPVQSNVGAPTNQNCEELVSINVSPCCNQPPSIEVKSQSHNLERSSSQTAEIEDTVVVSHESASQLVENQDLQSSYFGIGSGSQVNLERISSQTAEITDTVLLSQESTSQLGGNRELQSNHFGIRSESQVIHETSVEVSTSSWSNVDVSQIETNTVELPHQAGLQLGSVGNPYGSSNQFSHHLVTSFSSPPMHAAPLQHELGKIDKEIEQLQKSHEDMKLQMKSDREKETWEVLAQIRNKYNMKLQVAEAEFSYKNNVLDKNWNKVLVNQFLAESFSFSCGDLCWLRGIQQAAPSSSMQYLHR
ncbi:hypothetical protein ACS0TY_020336 [Phlomoides rotata]